MLFFSLGWRDVSDGLQKTSMVESVDPFQGGEPLQMARGNAPILSGTFSGVEVQYLNTERELGVILEVFSHMPEGAELHRQGERSPTRLERRTGADAPSRLIPPDQENPLGPCTSSASLRSGPETREWHYGQRHMKGRTYRSDTWPYQPATAVLKETLANGEPSIHGTILVV